jgi:hypothetical protein
MKRQRDRVDGTRDQLGARAGRLQCRGEGVAGRALAVDADRQSGGLAQARHQLRGAVGLQRACRIVQEDPRGAQVRQLARLLHQRTGLTGAARAVDEARLELAARLGDRVCGLPEVRDVVERVVQPEDIDPVRGRGRDEAANEVVVDRTRADEEATAQRQAERGLHARFQRPDALPRALDTAPHGALEAPAAGHLEVGEACAVEDFRDAQLLCRRQPPCQGLLPEEPDGRVGEARHAGSLAPVQR